MRQSVSARIAASGFTLIELLVVVVIIGILVSIASLSMGVLGRDNQSEDEAKRLSASLAQTLEEAELQGQDLGLLIERDGYLFMRYDYQAARWQELTGDELTARRQIPAGLSVRLWLEGREVVLKLHSDNQALLTAASSSSASRSGAPFSAAGSTSFKQGVQQGIVPQIAILSSGELSPFELRIQRESSDFAWVLTGKADNTLELTTVEGAS